MDLPIEKSVVSDEDSDQTNQSQPGRHEEEGGECEAGLL